LEKKDDCFKYNLVSQAVDSLHKSRKKDINLPVEERISSSLSPSNIDPEISADNLKQELLGKSKVVFTSLPSLVKGQ
jgi:hypothetical protein